MTKNSYIITYYNYYTEVTWACTDFHITYYCCCFNCYISILPDFFFFIFSYYIKSITSCQYCEFWGAFHYHRHIFSSQTTAVALKMFINDFPFMESMPSNNNNFVLKSEPFSEGIYNGNVWITGNNCDNDRCTTWLVIYRYNENGLTSRCK